MGSYSDSINHILRPINQADGTISFGVRQITKLEIERGKREHRQLSHSLFRLLRLDIETQTAEAGNQS